MQLERAARVTRIADWEYEDVVYYLHMGCDNPTFGHLTILALGPAAAYRAVVIGPHAARQALRRLLDAADAAARSAAAECLLATRDAIVH